VWGKFVVTGSARGWGQWFQRFELRRQLGRVERELRRQFGGEQRIVERRLR
jgi:hypothetical protein